MGTQHQCSVWKKSRLLLAVVSALIPTVLLGQTPEGSRESSQEAGGARLQAVLEQLVPDQRLRIETGDGEATVEGRYLGMEDDSLLLGTGARGVSMPTAEIERLWTRGRSTARGALVGGGAGLVLGAVYGALISEVTCAESSCTTLGLVAAVGGVGAASGAALGALVGLAIPRWRLRFP